MFLGMTGTMINLILLRRSDKQNPRDFEEIRSLIESAKKSGKWLVLAGHEMGEEGPQTTHLSMLEELMKYAANPANGVWLAPVGTVADYISNNR